MIFDLILGNPPFSTPATDDQNGTGSKICLYPPFFKLATDHSTYVAMVMPRTDKKVDNQMTEHNHLIERHAQDVTDCTHHFNVRGEQNYVIWDKTKKPKTKYKWHQPIHRPDRERLDIYIGKTVFAYVKGRYPGVYKDKPDGYSVPGIHKVNSKGLNLVWIKPSEIKTSLLRVSAPYLVVIPSRMFDAEDGITYCEIVKNEGHQWGDMIYAIPTYSLEDAQACREWLLSDEMHEYVSEMGECASINRYRKLPSHRPKQRKGLFE